MPRAEAKAPPPHPEAAPQAPSPAAGANARTTSRPPRRSVALVRWLLAWSFRLLTRPGRMAFVHLATWLWFDILRHRRRLILANLTRAFPDWPEARRRAVGRASVQNLCHSAVEAFLLPFLNQDNLAREVTFHGVDRLKAARAEGRGVLLLVLHLGNVEKLMAACSLAGMQANVIAKRFKNAFFDDLIYGTRRSFGTRFIDPHGARTAFDILHALRRNDYVAFVLDQHMRSQFGVATTFFGHPTTTAYGLALFALKSRAPVVAVYCHRDATGRLHVCFSEVIEPVNDPDRDAAVAATTQRYNDVMEAIIRRHPEQWMWMHNRWKSPR